MYSPRCPRAIWVLVIICTIFFSGCGKSAGGDQFQKIADLNKPEYSIGAVVGAASEPYVPEAFPLAVEKQFPDVSDMVMALEKKQVDAVVFTRPAFEAVLNEQPDKFQIIEEPLGKTAIHTVISPRTKWKNLPQEINDFLREKKADGTLDRLYTYWFVEHNTAIPPDSPRAPRDTGKKLVAGTLGTIVPASFYAGNELSGYDIELVELFAHEYGYELEFRVESIVSLLTDTEFGKIDLISGSIMYTPERAERVIFPQTPLFEVPISAMVRRNPGETGVVGAEGNQDTGFFGGIKTSLEKTLVHEDRYKMILDGLEVTFVLSLGSLLLGTFLGFVFCLMKRSSLRIVAKPTEAFIALISGLPIVLTLMICFYIVFAGTGLSEISISIIAFAIDFGCYVAIILNSGIESVDPGEIEAAIALGMSKWQAFRTIIFPQAVQKTFGVYRRQVISLIKATSIVGYIAVQDLTKVSDIIRARTYDAFFSLVFTAAIYFLLARICIFLLDRADHRLNRRKRNVEG